MAEKKLIGNGTTILFSRKYKGDEGPSDDYIASTLSKRLCMRVFETTFKTSIGLKRLLSQYDAKTSAFLLKSIFVIHYDDPSIFKGVIQKILPNRFFAFYDVGSHLGGLSFANAKGPGSRSLNKLYEFRVSDVDELFLGVDPSSGYYEKLLKYPTYCPDFLKPCPVGLSWRLLKVNSNASFLKAVLRSSEAPYCRHYHVVEQTTDAIEDNIFKAPLETFDGMLSSALKFRAHPFELYTAWPILGTEFVVVTKDIQASQPEGIVAIFYFGRKKLKSSFEACQSVEKILAIAP